METLGLKDSANETGVSLESLAALTGFPVDYIRKELLLEGESLSMDELRAKVLAYLDSHFQF